MRVRYNSSLWCEDKGFCGTPQRTNWEFEYAGAKRFIPVIYRFSKGIVFDILTILDETRLRKFFERYENHEKEMTPLERRCAEQEHPCQDISIKEIWINQRRVEGGFSSSCGMSMPWRQERNLSRVQKAYKAILKDNTCFACQRYCVPYPETDSKAAKIKRLLRLERINSIRFSTSPVHQLFPLDIRFGMSMQDEQKAICFKHPVTGITHTLYFQMVEPLKIPLEATGNRRLYMTQSMYEIDPALPEGDSLRFDSSTPYTIEPPEVSLMPAAAASIGIIGGADGPTAIFIGGTSRDMGVPRGLHGLPLHRCLSVPSFKESYLSEFSLEGINTRKYDSMEYHLGDPARPVTGKPVL